MKIIVTGGAGFIGSTLIRYIINHANDVILNIDNLTYAGNLKSLLDISDNKNYFFKKLDICDFDSISELINAYQPDAIMHLAAETHVDRSILESNNFISTNILGTYTLLEASRLYWDHLSIARKKRFRFHHISTDEVYGDLEDGQAFVETTPYAPSSPYAASKASSDHLVRVWHRTYNLPTIISNCSNNYGPYQFPEKLIPLIIFNAINGKKLPVYGKGEQVRDWLFVEDHVKALYAVLNDGAVGETYNIGGANEKRNIDVVNSVCELLEELVPSRQKGIKNYRELITFVQDRPGHDIRYAIDSTKITNYLGWKPVETFESGLRKTVEWYLYNQKWVNDITTGAYAEWIRKHYK